MLSSDQDFIKEFLVESYENLGRLDQEFVALEENPSDRATLGSVFRTIHTIKGTCGFLGFGKLEKVTHNGENLLSKLRDGSLALTPEMTTALLRMVDAVREMLANIETSQAEGDTDYSALIADLTRLQAISAAKPFGQILVDQGKVTQDAADEAASRQAHGDPRHIGEILVAEGQIPAHEVVNALNTQAESRAASGNGAGSALADQNIRVDVALLDKLMNLVGELVLARNQVLQFSSNQKDSAFAATTQHLNLITTELQESVMKTRMQPIGNIWSKFPRVVRDLAVSCGKQIQIEMEGKETELDKTIIEAIRDPLTHLVRNSCDHGIETPERRIAAGKPVEGRLLLRAFHEGGQVNIEIIDDGAGIDPEKMKAKAIEKNLITPVEAARMTEREALDLMFLPGFSTAARITNVSGRGVGMDVVKTNIEKIGGMVDVDSRVGKGVTVRMKIPLTLAIIPALIVTSGNERFAIPQVNLLELVRLEDGQGEGVEMLHGVPVFRLRGNLLPLVELERELGKASASKMSDQAGTNIVVLQAGERAFGLVVEGIHDTEEIVVKPLGKHLKNTSVFAGATIMGDGTVALILDVVSLAQRSSVSGDGRERARTEVATHQANANMQALLVFSVDDEGRMAIPLSDVGRLEELSVSSIEKSGCEEVIQYRGEIMPLVRLRQRFGFHQSESEGRDSIHVVVCSDPSLDQQQGQRRNVGLVVENIVDIVHEEVTVRRDSKREGVLGSAVIQQRVTELLDVHAVVSGASVAIWEKRV